MVRRRWGFRNDHEEKHVKIMTHLPIVNFFHFYFSIRPWIKNEKSWRGVVYYDIIILLYYTVQERFTYINIYFSVPRCKNKTDLRYIRSVDVGSGFVARSDRWWSMNDPEESSSRGGPGAVWTCVVVVVTGGNPKTSAREEYTCIASTMREHYYAYEWFWIQKSNKIGGKISTRSRENRCFTQEGRSPPMLDTTENTPKNENTGA